LDTNWVNYLRHKNWPKKISYYNKNSISNSISSRKNHSLIRRIIIRWINFWSYQCKKTWTIIYYFFSHSNKRRIILVNSTPKSKLSHWSTCSWKNEQIKNFCKLDNFCFSIIKLLSFTSCYTSSQQKFLKISPRYKSWPQLTSIICSLHFGN
jgi:hypothetical protein